MITKACHSGGLTELTRKENIDIMIEVESDVNLHLRAWGNKMTGITNNLDGKEDHLIKREALIFLAGK